MKQSKHYIHAAIVICTLTMAACFSDTKKSTAVSATDDASQFVALTDVVPDAILEIRYFGTYNFVGTRIDGYEEPTVKSRDGSPVRLRNESKNRLILQDTSIK